MKEIQCLHSSGVSDVASAYSSDKFCNSLHLHQTLLCTSDKNTYVTPGA